MLGLSEWASVDETSGLARSQVDLAFRVAVSSTGLTSPSRGVLLFSDDDFWVVAVLGLIESISTTLREVRDRSQHGQC